MGKVVAATFPELKVMHQGTTVTVQGALKDFDSYTVSLDSVVITNYAVEPAPNKASDATSEPAPGADSSAHQG